jgi:uncharacterized protein with HEPN domain
MQPDERDAGYLWDMLNAARTIREFTSGVDFHQYLEDKKLQLAIERAIEIIGEAARHVSEPFRQAHSEIPWQAIIAQRNVLIHEYGEIKQELIWKVATIRVPELMILLEPLVPPPPPEIDQ